MSVSLEDALTEKQLATLNKKDLVKLKLLAKVILEEKSVIKRKEDVENTEENGAYMLEFLQDD
jgi:hypothetical protein